MRGLSHPGSGDGSHDPAAAPGGPPADGSQQGHTSAITASTGLPSLPARALQVLVSPGELFEKLKVQPVWFWMMLLTAVASGLSVWFIPDEAWTAFFREQALEQGRLDPSQMPEVGAPFRIFGSLAASVSLFLLALVLSAFTFGVFVFLLGDEGTYKQHLAVVAHASVVPAIGAFATLPLRISQLDPQLTLSVGTLLPFVPDGYFFNVLQSLDLFALGAAVLTGLGISVLDPRRTWASGASVMVGLTVVFATVVAAFI